MVIIDIFMLAFPRLICQLCIGKRFYMKFRVNYRGIKSLPFYLFDWFVFENAFQNAKKTTQAYRLLKRAHNIMLLNLILIFALPIILFLYPNDPIVFTFTGILVVFESTYLQVYYRRNIGTK